MEDASAPSCLHYPREEQVLSPDQMLRKKKKKSHVLAVEVRFSGAELHKFSFIRWNTKENLKKEIHLKRLKELHKTSFSFGLSSCKKILTA